MTHGHFESTFSKYAFGRGEGVTKKSTLCTLVKMMTLELWTTPYVQSKVAAQLRVGFYSRPRDDIDRIRGLVGYTESLKHGG